MVDQPLRILEIGGVALFVLAAPDQTEFRWTATKPRQRAHLALGPIKLLRDIIRLRRGEYDLLVVHAPLYAPWHPRSFFGTLRDWNVRFPLGLFAIFAWRFVHLFHDVPIAVVDIEDSYRIGRHNFFLLDRCKAFFKRELLADHWLSFLQFLVSEFSGAALAPPKPWPDRQAQATQQRNASVF